MEFGEEIIWREWVKLGKTKEGVDQRKKKKKKKKLVCVNKKFKKKKNVICLTKKKMSKVKKSLI